VSRYLRILSRRAAMLPFLAAVVARLPIAMGPLGIVILVQHVRGAYASAGLVTAAFGVGSSVATPIWGRLMDRRGQAVVIGPVSLASGALLATLAESTVHGAPDIALVGLAAGVGITFPPISPAMRGAWRWVLDTDQDRRAAYALDAVAVETIFVGGPLLLSLLLVFAAPVVPLLVTAGLLAGGGVGYALTGAARHWHPEPHEQGHGHRGGSPLRVPAVLLVLVVAAAMAVGFGLCDVSIAATARKVLGAQSKVGWLFAAIAGGSATGGLWYGSRVWHRSDHKWLPITLGGLSFGLLVTGILLTTRLSTAWGPLPLILPVLFFTGLNIAPGLIMLANQIDEYAPRDRLGEAQSWLNTSFTSGGALGTAAAGVLVDTGGPARGFLGAATAVATAVAVALMVSRGRRAGGGVVSPR
jgi:predicted MFS family arabinose efflux permease